MTQKPPFCRVISPAAPWQNTRAIGRWLLSWCAGFYLGHWEAASVGWDPSAGSDAVMGPEGRGHVGSSKGRPIARILSRLRVNRRVGPTDGYQRFGKMGN